MTAHAQAPISLFDLDAVPDEVRLTAARDGLVLTWGAEDPIPFAAEALRASCRCAWCTRQRADHRFPDAFPGIAITHLALVADYALNLHFSDGHARGIYPFSTFRARAAAPSAEQNP